MKQFKKTQIPQIQKFNIFTNVYTYTCPKCGATGEWVNREGIKDKDVTVRCYSCEAIVPKTATKLGNYFKE